MTATNPSPNGTTPTKTAQPTAPHAGPQPGGVPQTAGKIRPTLSNASNGIPLALSQIRDHLLSLTGGWPKVVAGALLFAREDPTTGREQAAYVDDAPGLFASLDRYCQVNWTRKAGCYSKEELVSNLRQECERYECVADLFHWPPLPGVLYLNPSPQPVPTGRLDELIALFDAHTEVDRRLVKAFALTPFWGGPPGKRPLFVFSTAKAEDDPNAGRGAGKTVVAQVVADVAGSSFPLVHKEADVDRVVSDLLSPNGMGTRLVLMDNVKTLKFSSPFIESLITAKHIGGHRLYQGHASRPNYLTYVMTANEPMLSTDLSTRAIPILLNRASKSSAWDENLEAVLNDRIFLEELYADILWHLQRPDTGYVEDSEERWAMWWKGVGARACVDGKELCRVRDEVKRRRLGVDADLSARELVEEALRAVMFDNQISGPDGAMVFFPTAVLGKMLANVLGRNSLVTEVGQRLNAIKPRNLQYDKNGPSGGRGYWWVGDHCELTVALGTGLSMFVEAPGTPSGYKKELLSYTTKVRNVFLKARGLATPPDMAGGEAPPPAPAE